MGHPADLSRGVLLLSDGRLGSYAVIGDLFQRTLGKAGVEVEQQPLDETGPGHGKPAGIAGSRVVVHNTIGPRLEPLPGAVNIALVHHEWDRYPRPWVERLNAFREVWATSAFVRRTLRRSGVRVPVLLRLPALDLDAIPRKRDYARRGPVRFLACGEAHFRKGFHLLMEGFLEAFPSPGLATLTIKTSSGCDWRPPREDVRFVTKRMDRDSLLALYGGFDIYVSASLGEGLGLPAAEAILAGVPVAANFWGGHRDLLKAPYFFRIPHSVAPQPCCSRPEYYAPGQKCAYSHPSSIAGVLRRAAASPAAERRRMARGARAALLERYGWRAVRGQFALALPASKERTGASALHCTPVARKL